MLSLLLLLLSSSVVVQCFDREKELACAHMQTPLFKKKKKVSSHSQKLPRDFLQPELQIISTSVKLIHN